MDFYTDECEEFTVRPVLTALKCSEDPPACFPCLPQCTKPTHYCCVKSKQKAPPRTPAYCDLREHHSRENSDPRERGQMQRSCREREPCCAPPPQRCQSCCEPTCKPVKTKYVIPCYRYEDGRITGQPTLLMRRACEVAVGARPRRKPFVESCFIADPDHQEHRYISEDERGNCCYHFEKTNRSEPAPKKSVHLYGPCHSSPECQYYGQYVSAIPMPLSYHPF